MLEKMLCEWIELVILKILWKLLELLCIDIERALYKSTSSIKTSQEVLVLLNAVNQLDNCNVKFNKAS